MNLSAALLNENNALAQMSKQAGTQVTKAIYSASNETGVDFGYLMKQAKVESSFDIDAQAKTSSARGLYQFLNATWLEMIDKYGEKHGINPDQSKEDLLKLRDDPETASKMAAEFASQNQSYLEKTWGGEIGATELYLAHFMGAGGAASFLKAREANPLQPAADLYEKAAKANQNVFYDPETKRARTLEEVYQFFDQKFADVKTDKNIAADDNNSTTSSTLPLFTFNQRINTTLQYQKPSIDTLSLFSNMPQSSDWLKLNTVDFISLLRSA